jgi:phage-related protein
MAAELADLVLKVGYEGKEADAGLSKLEGHASKSGGFFKEAGHSLLGFVAAGVGIGSVTEAFHFVKDTVGDFITEASQAALVTGQMNAVLKSTKGASGETVDSLNALAASLSKTTTYTDDAIKGGENMLLTFTNIGKNVFPQATKTVLDMSTALGQDLKSSSIQLGKALNDPVAGISALSRVGVTFSDQQKNLIKSFVDTGQTAKAQGVILAELNKEFGGSAEAAGNTFPGKLQILRNSFQQMKQEIGGAIIPILSQLLTAFTPLIEIVGSKLTGALTAVSGFLANFSKNTSDLSGPLSNLKGILGTVAGILEGAFHDSVQQAWQIFLQLQPSLIEAYNILKPLGAQILSMAPMFLELFKSVSPLGAELKALVPALAGLLPYIANFVSLVGGALLDAFRQIAPPLIQFVSSLQSVLIPVIGQLAQILGPVINTLGVVFAAVIKALVPVIQAIIGELQSEFIPALKQLIPIIVPIVAQIAKWVQQLAQDLLPIIQLVGGILQTVLPYAIGVVIRSFQLVVSVVQWVWPLVQAIIQGALGYITAVIKFFSDLLHGQWGKLWQDILNIVGSMKDQVIGIIGALVGMVINLFKGMFGGLLGAVGNGIGNLLGLIGGLPGRIMGALSGLPGQLLSFGGKIIGSLADGIRGAIGNVLGAIGALKDKALGALGDLANGLKNTVHNTPVLGGIAGALGFASGTNYAPGGNAWIGEGGEPELVVGPHFGNLPRGSGVYPLSQLAAGSGGARGFGSQEIYVMLDTEVLTQATLREMPRQVFLKTGGRS